MATVTICSDSGAPKNKVWHCFHCFSIYLPWSDGTGCHDLSFLDVEFSANFFTLLFCFHQEALSSSLLSAIWVVSSAYLRLLIFLLAILIPACASSSSVFGMMYSAYKLNKQAGWQYAALMYSFRNLEPVCFSMSASNVASWPAYRFLRRQVRWSGMPGSWRILFYLQKKMSISHILSFQYRYKFQNWQSLEKLKIQEET